MRSKAIPVMDPEVIGIVRKNIAEIRKKKGLTQTELGNRIGVSQRVISYYENEAPNIALDAIISISKALKCSTSKLLQAEEGEGEEIPVSKAMKKRLALVGNLSPRAQRTISEMIDALAKSESIE